MTRPRQVLPGTSYLLTRRTVQRQYLLSPSRLIDQTYLYCLGVAAQKYGVTLHAAVAMSNHHHPVATDAQGQVPAFMGWLDEFVAKTLNVSLGRWEALWAPGSYSAVSCETPDDTLRAMTYAATNPVRAGAVCRADLWPGVNILPADLGRPIKVKKPRTFFRRGGPLPDEVELVFLPPPGFEHLSLDEFRALWQQQIDEEEARLRAERKAKGLGFAGRQAVRKQSRYAFPKHPSKRRGLNPRVKCRDKRLRIAALERLQRFWQEHHAARERFKAGVRDVLFPAGTYWMRLHAGVHCAPG